METIDINIIKELIISYKRKVKTVDSMIEENISNLHTVIRLKAKKSCYRSFINELEASIRKEPNYTEETQEVYHCLSCGALEEIDCCCEFFYNDNN